jgi:hypothetical protein
MVQTAFLHISYCLSIHFRFHAFGQYSAKLICIANSMLLYNFFLKLIWGLIITLLFAVHYNQ